MNSHLFHSNILHWYKKNGRDLPWRTTKNPYRILLSEIMAQQTQVNRVAQFYLTWLKEFPTLSLLARATKADVLRRWSGLGYNSRALRLHELAKRLSENSGGRLPRTIEELRALPGVGKYTAHAIACFAFGASVPVVDVNVRRIFSRVFWNARSAADVKPEKEIWTLAEKFLPRKNAAEWNQALMDMGALVCDGQKSALRIVSGQLVVLVSLFKCLHHKIFVEKESRAGIQRNSTTDIPGENIESPS